MRPPQINRVRVTIPVLVKMPLCGMSVVLRLRRLTWRRREPNPRQVVAMLRNSAQPEAEGMMRIIRTWASKNGVKGM